MLESAEVKSMKELARREGVDDSYVSRMVNSEQHVPRYLAEFEYQFTQHSWAMRCVSPSTPVS